MTAMRCTILIVEDDEATRELYAYVLSKAGYSILLAGDGETALRILAQNADIRLVISDLMLPDMDGNFFLEAFRHSYQETRLILCSGVVDPPKDVSAIYDVSLILAKPIDIDELVTAVRNRAS